MTQSQLKVLAWGSFTLSFFFAVTAWGANYQWQFSNGYQWFPLFGLVAWMTMWTHYIVGAVRLRNRGLEREKSYSLFSGYVVLACLLLHPAILAYEQSKNAQGLPPDSFISYVGEDLKLAVFAGSFSLLLFLSFEVFKRIKNNPHVQRYWLAVSLSQTLAMILIFIHGLRLGSIVEEGWFRFVWLAYGLALLPCLYIIHRSEIAKIGEKAE